MGDSNDWPTALSGGGSADGSSAAMMNVNTEAPSPGGFGAVSKELR